MMTGEYPPGSIPWHPFIGGYGCVSLNPRMIPVMVPMPEYDSCVTVVTVDERCVRCGGNSATCDCE